MGYSIFHCPIAAPWSTIQTTWLTRGACTEIRTLQPLIQIWPGYLSGLRRVVLEWSEGYGHLQKEISSFVLSSCYLASLWSLLTTSSSLVLLSWSCHILDTVSKAKQLLGFLFRVFRDSSPHCLANLYKSIVVPHLDCCCCVWDPNRTIHIKWLEGVQSFAAKIVTNDWSTNTETLKSRLHWPSLKSRCLIQKSAM